jgi:hypothetical protein
MEDGMLACAETALREAEQCGAKNENEAWVGLCNKLWLEADRKDPYCACIQATISMVGKAGRARMEGK